MVERSLLFYHVAIISMLIASANGFPRKKYVLCVNNKSYISKGSLWNRHNDLEDKVKINN
jgi:hypothetical protein